MKDFRQRRGGTGVGIIVGIVSTLMLLTVIFGIMMMVMGRCPMCGNMMH